MKKSAPLTTNKTAVDIIKDENYKLLALIQKGKPVAARYATGLSALLTDWEIHRNAAGLLAGEILKTHQGSLPTASDSDLCARARVAYRKRCDIHGSIHQEPSLVRREGNQIVLKNVNGILARFRVVIRRGKESLAFMEVEP